MPKSKTANVTAEAPVAAEPRKRTSTAKPKTTAAAATHKRTVTTTKPKSTDKPAKSSVPVTAKPAVAPRVVTHAEIAALAYSYWEERGYCGGTPQEDWLRAERELAKLA